ncbi:MAG: CehA/McbA family metallohydrolase [Thermodesulfovibrionales bacterium]
MAAKIDLHNHSFYSEDSSLDPEEAVQRAVELGLHGIAFTEHNSFRASEPVEALKEKYRGTIRIFRGAEYNAEEGHILVFGIRDDITDAVDLYAPAREIIRVVKERGGVVIVPHPFREWSLLRADIGSLNGICAVEAYNGHNNRTENRKALEAAHSLQLPTTGGSDSHCIDEVGSCYTEFFGEVTYENFLDMLREGRYRGFDRFEHERNLR